MENFVIFNPSHFLASEVYKLPNQTLYMLAGEKNVFYFLNSGKEWLLLVNDQPTPDTTYSDYGHDIEWGIGDGFDEEQLGFLEWLNKNKDDIGSVLEYTEDLINTLKANNRNYKLSNLIS